MNFFGSILSNPMVRAYALALARHAGSFIGGLLAAWLIKHGVDSADANGILQGVAGLVVLGVSATFSVLDVKDVGRKSVSGAITIAQAVGKDRTVISQVRATQGRPAALTELIQELRNGKV